MCLGSFSNTYFPKCLLYCFLKALQLSSTLKEKKKLQPMFQLFIISEAQDRRYIKAAQILKCIDTFKVCVSRLSLCHPALLSVFWLEPQVLKWPQEHVSKTATVKTEGESTGRDHLSPAVSTSITTWASKWNSESLHFKYHPKKVKFLGRSFPCCHHFHRPLQL